MLSRSPLLLAVAVCLAACLHLLTALPLEHQETLLDQESEQLRLESTNEAVVREKRTIGFLRQAFPTLSQIIDRKIQSITRLLFRLIGRLVLRGNGAGGGGGGGGDSGDDERRVQITLPTFPPSEDDDEDEDEDSTGGSVDDGDATTTTTEPSADENDLSRRKRQAPAAAPAAAAAAAEEEEYEDDDQAAAATGDNEVVSEVEDDADDTESAESEDDPRGKRFSGGLGGGLGGDAAGGTSGGGSGNFLFDIIRLVAGSGTTQNQDEAENAPLDETNTTHTGKADDGYGAGVPGPLTRLFVIANRGIANLIQDLILRLAQTSERIVNFKARLITSII